MKIRAAWNIYVYVIYTLKYEKRICFTHYLNWLECMHWIGASYRIPWMYWSCVTCFRNLPLLGEHKHNVIFFLLTDVDKRICWRSGGQLPCLCFLSSCYITSQETPSEGWRVVYCTLRCYMCINIACAVLCTILCTYYIMAYRWPFRIIKLVFIVEACTAFSQVNIHEQQYCKHVIAKNLEKLIMQRKGFKSNVNNL